jgi:hypothetical protein
MKDAEAFPNIPTTPSRTVTPQKMKDWSAPMAAPRIRRRRRQSTRTGQSAQWFLSRVGLARPENRPVVEAQSAMGRNGWSSRTTATCANAPELVSPGTRAGITTSSEERTLGAISLHFGCADQHFQCNPTATIAVRQGRGHGQPSMTGGGPVTCALNWHGACLTDFDSGQSEQWPFTKWPFTTVAVHDRGRSRPWPFTTVATHDRGHSRPWPFTTGPFTTKESQ